MKAIRVLLLGCASAFGLYYPQNSVAKEWYFQPNAHFKTLYNDNIRLFSQKSRQSLNTESFGFITSAGANMGVRSDRYDIGLNASGVINRYISNFDLNSDNVFLNATSVFKVNEKNILRLNGDYIKDSTLASQLDISGITSQNIIRETLAINPQWTYFFSKLTSVETSYRHADVNYAQPADPTLSNFFDYTSDNASIEVSHQWNEVLKSHFNFSALILDFSALNGSTNFYTSNLGVDYKFIETWTTSLEIGIYNNVSESNSNGNTTISNKAGPVFLFKTKKSFETSNLEAGYSRKGQARGTGGISLVDSAFIRFNQQLSEQFNVGIHGSYGDLSRFSGSANQNSFTTYSAGINASWIISPQFDLTLSYQYTTRESKANQQTANSNAAFLLLNYNWDTFSTNNF